MVLTLIDLDFDLELVTTNPGNRQVKVAEAEVDWAKLKDEEVSACRCSSDSAAAAGGVFITTHKHFYKQVSKSQ